MKTIELPDPIKNKILIEAILLEKNFGAIHQQIKNVYQPPIDVVMVYGTKSYKYQLHTYGKNKYGQIIFPKVPGIKYYSKGYLERVYDIDYESLPRYPSIIKS